MYITSKSPSTKFNFKQLNYTSYCRFLELLHDDNVNCKFMLTSKKNYINSIKKRGITAELTFTVVTPYKVRKNLSVELSNGTEECYRTALHKLSRFAPYFNVQSCYVLTTYSVLLLHFVG